jgi:hypothetical protein
MTPATVTESLRGQLNRETQEYEQLIGPDRDALLAEITDATISLAEHTRAGRATGIAEATDRLATLAARRMALAATAIEKKEAVRTTERQLAAERRHRALEQFRAAVADADPIAAKVSTAMYTVIDAVQALAQNRHAAATALQGYPDDQIAFGGAASMHAVFGDIEYHLRAALNLPQASGPVRGDADTQQLAVQRFAATLR